MPCPFLESPAGSARQKTMGDEKQLVWGCMRVGLNACGLCAVIQAPNWHTYPTSLLNEHRWILEAKSNPDATKENKWRSLLEFAKLLERNHLGRCACGCPALPLGSTSRSLAVAVSVLAAMAAVAVCPILAALRFHGKLARKSTSERMTSGPQ